MIASFAAFEKAAPELAAAARRLLTEEGGAAVAFIATVARDGRPRLAPFCPIFSGDDLYICAGAGTPKHHDLSNDRRYALHAALGANDEELQLAGLAERVDAPALRARVHEDIRFQFEASDPIFRLGIERCLWGFWENPGQPDTRPIRCRWRTPD